MNKKGFSLIELIVIIIILGVLSSIAILIFYTRFNKSCIDEITICSKCNASLSEVNPDCSGGGCGCGDCFKRCPKCKYEHHGLPLDKCKQNERN